MTLAFALWLLGLGPTPGIHHCTDFVFVEDQALVCFENGREDDRFEVYPVGNYVLAGDTAEVWHSEGGVR